MKISVIGCGRWGSFIAWYLQTIGHEVSLYGRETSKHMQAFLQTRTNGLVTLSGDIHLETDLARALEAPVVCISVGAQNLRALGEEIASLGGAARTFVLCMKGIEISSGKRLTQVAREVLGEESKLAVWLGPGHVQEFTRGIPNCMVIDSDDEAVKHALVDAFSGSLIRFYYGTDLIGNEIGAAAKNVIGIAAGILDGYGIGSLKGALMSRGTREVARLIASLGGNELSAYGLCHLGDYEATVFSKYSHNRRFGEALIKGEPYDELAEGYYTVRAMIKIGQEKGVELPISRAVYEVLYEKRDAKEAMDALFTRRIKHEF